MRGSGIIEPREPDPNQEADTPLIPEDFARVTAIVTAAEERVDARAQETARAMQTEILRGLEGFARGNFARMHRLETSDIDTNTRIAALEERGLYLETRRQ